MQLITELYILEHTLKGRIHISRIDIHAILVESKSKPVLHQVTWLGHSEQISKLGRTVDGQGLISKGLFGETISWELQNSAYIHQRSVLPFEDASHSITLLAGSLLKKQNN